MIRHLRTKLIAFVSSYLSGHVRTIRIKKNILALLVFKGISIVTGFLMFPMTLHYLNPTNYGIWLTLSSIIGWFTFFDIGLGNGLRNKFAEAMARNDVELARIYVSTTYAFLSMIIGTVFVVFLVVNPFLNWSKILNTPSDLSDGLSLLVLITFGFFCIRFIFGLIGTILISDQKPALNSFLEVSGNLLSLCLIWILTITTRGSLLYLAIAVSISTAIVPIVASFWLYSNRYKNVRPSRSYVRRAYARELMKLGLRFFFLQIGAIIIFSTSNILISQLFAPKDVVPYNIAFKYYNIVLMLFSILLAPFWSAYTEAYTRGDMPWIHKTFTMLKRAWLVTAFVVVIMSLFADDFYRLWIGKEIHIPISVSLAMGVYVLISIWCNIFVNFINGTGKIQLQVIAAIAVGVLNIPLAIFFSQYCQLGIAGVILAPCVCLLPLCFVWPMQVKRILSGNATGIWIK